MSLDGNFFLFQLLIYPSYFFNTLNAARTFLANSSGGSIDSKCIYIARCSSNNQRLCTAVTSMSQFLNSVSNGLISSCKRTVSPRFSAFPWRSKSSKVKNCGFTKGEFVLLPRIVNGIFLNFWTRQTPSKILLLPPRIRANSENGLRRN